MSFLIPSTIALTVNNILRELKRVNWETLCSFAYVGGVLQLPASQRHKIEEKYDGETERKKEGIKYWLWNHPFASWRRLITRLDWMEEHTVANQMHGYAEKVTGMSLIIESIDSIKRDSLASHTLQSQEKEGLVTSHTSCSGDKI